MEHFGKVFPAYAGVFLPICLTSPFLFCLPRIRGGVSLFTGIMSMGKESSPHTRGCFQTKPGLSVVFRVFPAYAGVFPAGDWPAVEECGLPRIRGGVS